MISQNVCLVSPLHDPEGRITKLLELHGKKLINLYAKKNGSKTYDETMLKLQDNFLIAPLYAIKKSFFLSRIIFMQYKDHELSNQAAKVKQQVLILILCVTSLAVTLIVLGNLMI